MVIRPANRDTAKRVEFVKDEKTERGGEGGGWGRFSENFFVKALKEKKEGSKLYMQIEKSFPLRK